MNDDNERIPVDITPDKGNGRDNLDVVVLDDDQVSARDDDSDDTDPVKAIETLKKKLKMEQEARQEAEQRAQKAAFQVQKASYEVEDTQMHLVANAIETIKRDNEILTANYAESMRNGNFEDAARIQMAEITGMEPAAGEGLFIGGIIFEIASEYGRTTHANIAGFACG